MGQVLTEIDIAVAMLYVAVVLMAARFCRAPGIVLVGAGCVGRTVLSYFLSPPGGPVAEGLINTAISIAAIGLKTFPLGRGALLQEERRDLGRRGQPLVFAKGPTGATCRGPRNQ